MWFFSPTPEPNPETPDAIPTKTQFWAPFQLPITYLDEEQFPLSPTVASDLELLPTSSNTNTNQNQNTNTQNPTQKTIYDHLLLTETASPFAKQMTANWAQQFTTNTNFLQETQQIILNLPTTPETTSQEPPVPKQQNLQEIKPTWEEITLTQDFKEKFNYLDVNYLEPFNQNALFLECLNLIHLSTPIFSFLMFIFFILLPIFLITYSKTPFSVDAYVQHMASLAKVSFMGKMAKSAVFNGWYHYQTLGMVIGCFIFYGVQFYNSYISYFRFWRNVELVTRHLLTVRQFVDAVIPRIQAFLQTCKSNAAQTYRQFCDHTAAHLQQLENIQTWLKHVQPYSYSVAICYDFGNLFQSYYELHTNREFDASIRYATGFQGYWENIQCLKSLLAGKSLSLAVFPPPLSADIPQPLLEPILATIPEEQEDAEDDDQESEEKPEKETAKEPETKTPPKKDNQIYGMYYPAHCKEDAVRNDCNLAENWIITGPNASGKTTYLKTAALNLIFTQQFGMGFYQHCVLYRPYTQFYTYLNIPDTSDRDSLFQAEVRRGKEILDAATLVVPVSGADTGSVLSTPQTPNQKQNIFLLMDELFSGTNHDDAVQAAYGFLCYLGNPARHASTRFLLTTHFVEICDKIQSTAPHVALNGKMMIEDISAVVSETEVEVETEKGEVEDSVAEVKVVEKAVEKEGEIGEIRYLYQFKEGISRLRCGIHILKQMNYPTEVMHYFYTFRHLKRRV